MTLISRSRSTLMPAVSAADGYSPTERVRRPHRVWNRPKCTNSAARMASVAKMLVPVKKTSPMSGIFDSSGTSKLGISPGSSLPGL